MNPGRRRATGSRSGARPTTSTSAPGMSPMSRMRRPSSPLACTWAMRAFCPSFILRREMSPASSISLEMGQPSPPHERASAQSCPPRFLWQNPNILSPSFNFIVTSGVAAPLGKHIPGPDGPRGNRRSRRCHTGRFMTLILRHTNHAATMIDTASRDSHEKTLPVMKTGSASIPTPL